MGLDRRIGTHYLRAGIGYGGSCFPKDMSFLKLLAGNSGYHFHLVSAVMEVNELQMRRPVAKLQKHLGTLRGKRIALLGLAFKANTDDLREAPSLVLAARLLAEGAEVVAWDPVADAQEILHGVEFADDAADALAAPTRRSSSPSGRSSASCRGPSSAGRCATRWSSTAVTSSTPTRCERPASSTRGWAARARRSPRSPRR